MPLCQRDEMISQLIAAELFTKGSTEPCLTWMQSKGIKDNQLIAFLLH